LVGDVHPDGSGDFKVRQAAWWNSDVGYEYRRQAYLFRAFVGAAVLLNPHDAIAMSAAPLDPFAVTMYVGIGFGFAPGD